MSERTTSQALFLLLLAIASIQNVEGRDLPKRTYTYKTVGEVRILADVYRKTDDIIRPAILYIHGGALIMGNRSWLDPAQAQKVSRRRLHDHFNRLSAGSPGQAGSNRRGSLRRLSMGADRRSKAVSD